MIKMQYQRPKTTYQETLSNEEIAEKLKNYKKVKDINKIPIGTHIRYFTNHPTTNKNIFRLGGSLNKLDPQGRYITLSNSSLNWSVQLNSSILYHKMTEDEIAEELRNEIKKEILSENHMDIMKGGSNENINDLKKQIKLLSKKIDEYKELEQKYNNVVTSNFQLTKKLEKIEKEIKKNKNII
jgi:hypothetical protein